VKPFDVICGLAEEELAKMADASVDLIMTSPPYADARKTTYGGIAPDDYCAWFMPIAVQLHRVLKPDGTFILNIKERVVDGERHTYVLDLIRQLRAVGFRWTEEYIWHKKNACPGRWPTRFRDSWERCLQFNKLPRFRMYQDAVTVPAGEWQRTRLAKDHRNDGRRHESRSGSNFGRKVSNWVGRDRALPTNVLHLAPETRNRNHPAPFPQKLPEFFIRCFTQTGDLVLDPFMGGGTTGIVALREGRRFVGIDKEEGYCTQAAVAMEGSAGK
jgi:DNA modification methylase